MPVTASQAATLPCIDVFRSVGVPAHGADRRGNATYALDKDLGKMCFRIAGHVPSAHKVEIPKANTNTLNLQARYLYIQLAPLPNTAGVAGMGPKTPVHLEGVPAGGMPEIAYFSLTIVADTLNSSPIRITMTNVSTSFSVTPNYITIPLGLRRWSTLAIDLAGLISGVYAAQYPPVVRHYSATKRLIFCANSLVKNVFVSDRLFTPYTISQMMMLPPPKESAACSSSRKPLFGTEFLEVYDWITIGEDAVPKLMVPLADDPLEPKLTAAAREAMEEKIVREAVGKARERVREKKMNTMLEQEQEEKRKAVKVQDRGMINAKHKIVSSNAVLPKSAMATRNTQMLRSAGSTRMQGHVQRTADSSSRYNHEHSSETYNRNISSTEDDYYSDEYSVNGAEEQRAIGEILYSKYSSAPSYVRTSQGERRDDRDNGPYNNVPVTTKSATTRQQRVEPRSSGHGNVRESNTANGRRVATKGSNDSERAVSTKMSAEEIILADKRTQDSPVLAYHSVIGANFPSTDIPKHAAESFAISFMNCEYLVYASGTRIIVEYVGYKLGDRPSELDTDVGTHRQLITALDSPITALSPTAIADSFCVGCADGSVILYKGFRIGTSDIPKEKLTDSDEITEEETRTEQYDNPFNSISIMEVGYLKGEQTQMVNINHVVISNEGDLLLVIGQPLSQSSVTSSIRLVSIRELITIVIPPKTPKGLRLLTPLGAIPKDIQDREKSILQACFINGAYSPSTGPAVPIRFVTLSSSSILFWRTKQDYTAESKTYPFKLCCLHVAINKKIIGGYITAAIRSTRVLWKDSNTETKTQVQDNLELNQKADNEETNNFEIRVPAPEKPRATGTNSTIAKTLEETAITQGKIIGDEILNNNGDAQTANDKDVRCTGYVGNCREPQILDKKPSKIMHFTCMHYIKGALGSEGSLLVGTSMGAILSLDVDKMHLIPQTTGVVKQPMVTKGQYKEQIDSYSHSPSVTEVMLPFRVEDIDMSKELPRVRSINCIFLDNIVNNTISGMNIGVKSEQAIEGSGATTGIIDPYKLDSNKITLFVERRIITSVSFRRNGEYVHEMRVWKSLEEVRSGNGNSDDETGSIKNVESVIKVREVEFEAHFEAPVVGISSCRNDRGDNIKNLGRKMAWDPEVEQEKRESIIVATSNGVIGLINAITGDYKTLLRTNVGWNTGCETKQAAAITALATDPVHAGMIATLNTSNVVQVWNWVDLQYEYAVGTRLLPMQLHEMSQVLTYHPLNYALAVASNTCADSMSFSIAGESSASTISRNKVFNVDILDDTLQANPGSVAMSNNTSKTGILGFTNDVSSATFIVALEFCNIPRCGKVLPINAGAAALASPSASRLQSVPILYALMNDGLIAKLALKEGASEYILVGMTHSTLLASKKCFSVTRWNQEDDVECDIIVGVNQTGLELNIIRAFIRTNDYSPHIMRLAQANPMSLGLSKHSKILSSVILSVQTEESDEPDAFAVVCLVAYLILRECPTSVPVYCESGKYKREGYAVTISVCLQRHVLTKQMLDDTYIDLDSSDNALPEDTALELPLLSSLQVYVAEANEELYKAVGPVQAPKHVRPLTFLANINSMPRPVCARIAVYKLYAYLVFTPDGDAVSALYNTSADEKSTFKKGTVRRQLQKESSSICIRDTGMPPVDDMRLIQAATQLTVKNYKQGGGGSSGSTFIQMSPFTVCCSHCSDIPECTSITMLEWNPLGRK